MTREYLLETVRTYRDTLKAMRIKPLADDADQLLQDLVDAGLAWEDFTLTVHAFVDLAERNMRRIA